MLRPRDHFAPLPRAFHVSYALNNPSLLHKTPFSLNLARFITTKFNQRCPAPLEDRCPRAGKVAGSTQRHGTPRDKRASIQAALLTMQYTIQI